MRAIKSPIANNKLSSLKIQLKIAILKIKAISKITIKKLAILITVKM
jgi:hypothetical protein